MIFIRENLEWWWSCWLILAQNELLQIVFTNQLFNEIVQSNRQLQTVNQKIWIWFLKKTKSFKARFGKLHRAAYRIINDINNLQETRKKAVVDKIVGNIIKTLVCYFQSIIYNSFLHFRVKHWVKSFDYLMITIKNNKHLIYVFRINSIDWIFNVYRMI